MKPPFIQIDLEATNRCNAKCYFCPRDMTPHQGLMSMEVFEQSLLRSIEYRTVALDRLGLDTHVALCGLGEPLLNPRCIDMVERLTDEGFYSSVSTNGALLDERKARALLDAGLRQIDINVGDTDEEYEEVYKLSWERTRDNVIRFAELAGDDCRVQVVLVNHRGDDSHGTRMVEYWRSHGIEHFLPFTLINRGGALFVDHMQYEAYPERATARELLGGTSEPICGIPFTSMFVGYDGNYYLCCSDWTKDVPLGTVFDDAFLDVMRAKYEHVATRDPLCRTCTLDPLNRVTGELRALADGESDPAKVDTLVAQQLSFDAGAREVLDRIDPELAAPVTAAPGRKLIPVRATPG